MEDLFSVAYQQTEDERDLEYAFFGIYDGHGGSEAAAFAKEHLMDSIVKQRQFWSDNDEDVLKAIRNGYMLTHLNMWKELEKWPKTVTGLPSTAGTTASVAFIRRGKIYVGHVGDSAIILGYQKEGSEEWAAKPLTLDHKPESTTEIERIQRCGGKVVSKAGVPRVVWNRPRPGHKGPIKKNTPMDEIPFLAVARSLGDLWSYNPQNDEFIVSPDPDVGVLTIDPTKFRCLIFGTDGLWNMISPEGAVNLVQATEKHNEAALVGGNSNQPRDWLNPSKSLVDHALERWSNTRMRADNTSVVTLMLDPPGPPRATVLRSRSAAPRAPADPAPRTDPAPLPDRPVPQNGLTIMTRYSDADRTAAPLPPLPPCATLDTRLSVAPTDDAASATSPAGTTSATEDTDTITTYGNPAESYFMARLLNRTKIVNSLASVPEELAHVDIPPSETRETTPPATRLSVPSPPPVSDVASVAPVEPREPSPQPCDPDEVEDSAPPDDGCIQINEVSSSSPTEAPPRQRGRRSRADLRPDEPPVANDRVLRSHNDAEPPPRPNTRQTATRSKGNTVSLDRVVILTRRAQSQTTPVPNKTEPRTPARKAQSGSDETVPVDEEAAKGARMTRSQGGTATPLAQKITRSIGAYARELRGAAVAAAAAAGARAGNSARAPGPARRTPAARRQGARSKENLGAGRDRAPAPAAPPASRPPRRRASADEVHSTTSEPASSRLEARALRSRNEPAPPPNKRARRETASYKAAVERVARGLGKRASGPWAPALSLRNRLRRRLVK